ncbi:putative WD repeat-containing protein alr3466 [Nostoc sp, PCC 7120] [Rhizoctonia solani]|uniref:Putative WD repeat-containing protein alr3466 [Nostoc sp, PCC 7120] n=1 Tax=Rhizoctonia solani TaxID=456999 RepID=A0A0K6G889_9AGAM|nr:putative WD repeat-containing protein alr3466 [Nostoc sp, PCC 7120] [Rhizoctonia solani]
MVLKRIFKRDKKKRPDGESGGSPFNAGTPSPDASIRSTSPPSGPSAAVSALVFQPFVPLPTSPPAESGQTEAAVATVDTWTNLTAFLDLLRQTPPLAPFVTVIDDLSWFIRAHEDIVATRGEYKALRTQLEELFKDLRVHFSGNTPPAMTTSMLDLCEAIQNEVRQVYGTQDRNMISRYMQANRDLDKITGCYRRIQGHLERVMLNASLHIWRTVDRQATEAQLRQLNPSMSACYDSAEANLVQRRECAPNTRKQVLLDLNAWKDKSDGEKVCWMNGMAGTGKTTISYTLCSTLRDSHQLGASFFCSRSLPACRDVKLVLPTIAYQLARFSSPYRGALLQVLDEDPDVHTKVPGVQLKRMILEPLQKVAGSLPTTVMVVIDALDECDDGNGVEQILQVLLERASELPIRFLVSSRPEYHIRERIKDSRLKMRLVLHKLDEAMVNSDIATYLQTELGSIAISLTNNQIAALVERAGALFIYAATVVRYIKDGDTLERLEAVLKSSGLSQRSQHKTKDIDRLYETVLLSALNTEYIEDPEKERIQLVLRTVVCAQEPLTIDALAGLLNLRRPQVMAALKPLWSVLHVSESNTNHRVSTLHASFPDYILDSTRSKQFACNPQTHHGKLTKLSLERIRQNPCQFNICNLVSSYVLDEDVPELDEKVKEGIPLDLLYACQYWAVHLSLSGSSDGRGEVLLDFLSKRLLLWMEVLNLTRRIDKGIEQMQLAITWLQSVESPESTMLLARDARRFVTMFATSPVSQSTPHLYASMLSSWPDHQPIVHHYAGQTNDLVRIQGVASVERQFGLLGSVPAGSPVYCVACSPNGKLIAAGTDDWRILIWDAVTLQMTIDPIQGHKDRVQAIAFSPDGTHICSGSYDKTICVWDPQSGELLAGPVGGYTGPVCAVSYAPDGQWLASGSLSGIVCIWSTVTWEQKVSPLRPAGERPEVVYSVIFSPNGAIIATIFGSRIYLWDPFSGQMIGELLNGHTDDIGSLAFLPDGKHLISGSYDCTICIWDVGSGQLTFGPFKEHTDGVCDIRLSPDARSFISVGDDDTVRIWNTATWESRILLRNTGLTRSARFSPDGSVLITGSADRNVRIWEVQQFSDGQVLNHQLPGHSGWIRSVAFSPCGTYMVSGSRDKTVYTWDLQTKQLILGPLKHTGAILSVGVSSDSNFIFSISTDRVIHVWSKQTGELEYVIGPIEAAGQENPAYREFWPADFLFSGRRIVCGSQSGRIYMQDDNKSASSAGHNNQVLAIAFSPDGQSFASGSGDGELLIWDTSTGEKLFEPLTRHHNRVNSIAFSPDGTRIASGSEDCTIRLWSSLTGRPLGNPFKGHSGVIRSVAFSPSGTQLVSGPQDRTVRIWDIPNEQSLAIFKGHIGIVLSVAFSPDGTQIVSGSADTAIRLWESPASCRIASPDDVNLSKISERTTNIAKEHLDPDWEMNTDGWVCDTQHQLLLWVPLDIRSSLLRRQNSGLISRQGCIELDFTDARIGDKWSTCYKPFPPYPEN